MVLDKGNTGKYVIYPEYFNVNISRARGRRVPKGLAVQEPKAEDINNICRKLDLSPVLEMHSSHPSRWFKGNGRVKVVKKYPKETTLKMIAMQLSRKQ